MWVASGDGVKLHRCKKQKEALSHYVPSDKILWLHMKAQDKICAVQGGPKLC